MSIFKSLFRCVASFSKNIPHRQLMSLQAHTKTLVPRFQCYHLFCLASGYVVTFKDDSSDEKEIKDKVKVAEPRDLSNTFQLKQSSNNALDSSMVVVSTSFRALHLAFQEYSGLLVSAITALLRALEIDPVMCEELGIDEHLSLVQSDIFLQKSQISDSLFVFEEATKLLSLAANITFLVGDETSSSLASSHLHNIQREVETIQSEIRKLEQEYLELQKQYIVKSQESS